MYIMRTSFAAPAVPVVSEDRKWSRALDLFLQVLHNSISLLPLGGGGLIFKNLDNR
jgi:hypothetical protein